MVMHKAAQAKNPLIIWQPIVWRKSWFKMPLCFDSVVVLRMVSRVVVSNGSLWVNEDDDETLVGLKLEIIILLDPSICFYIFTLFYIEKIIQPHTTKKAVK